MQIEWIMLADSAEVMNNKLYMMGGGWDHLVIKRQFPARHTAALAVALHVERADAPSQPQLLLRIEDDDANQLAKVNTRVDAERILSGGKRTRRVQLAFKVPLRFQHEGRYRIIAQINGNTVTQQIFQVSSGEDDNNRTPPEELQA